MDVFKHLGLGKLIDLSFGKRDASWNAFQVMAIKYNKAHSMQYQQASTPVP